MGRVVGDLDGMLWVMRMADREEGDGQGEAETEAEAEGGDVAPPEGWPKMFRAELRMLWATGFQVGAGDVQKGGELGRMTGEVEIKMEGMTRTSSRAGGDGVVETTRPTATYLTGQGGTGRQT